MLAAGIVVKARGARVASVALIAVTTFKCFLYDLGSLEGLYRVGAFVGLAVSLALVSLALQKYVLALRKGDRVIEPAPAADRNRRSPSGRWRCWRRDSARAPAFSSNARWKPRPPDRNGLTSTSPCSRAHSRSRSTQQGDRLDRRGRVGRPAAVLGRQHRDPVPVGSSRLQTRRSFVTGRTTADRRRPRKTSGFEADLGAVMVG